MKSKVLALIVVICASLLPSYGQNTAELRGTVTDRTGAVLPGASLMVIQKSSNQERQQLTDSNGSYVFPSLPNGGYLLRVELSGFKVQTRDGIVLQVGQRVNIDLSLEVGAINEEVTVTEDVSLMRTSNAEVSEVINNQRLAELPLNGRQFVQLTLLSDNVYLTPVGTRGAALAQTGRQVVIAGQRVGHNLYMLDGVSITDQYLNNLVISPSIDVLQEFKIQKSIYSAEFGGKSSANVNAVTKSGTNRFHGTLLEFIRNDIFDARNYFDPKEKPKPPLRLNQFGGSIGGPLVQNRAFFFANYEGSRERRALTRTFSMPSLKVRAGDFSGLPTIYDPLTTDADGNRLSFAENKIPRDRLNPVAVSFLQKVPIPTAGGEVQNFISSPSIKNDSDQTTLRLDYNPSTHQAFFARFTGANMVTFQPYGNSNLNEILVPGFGYQIVTRSRNVAVSHTHAFSPALVNEFRAGFLRVTGGQESENRGFDFGRTSGLQGVTIDPAKMGYPAVNFADAYSAMGDPATLTLRRNNSFDFFNNVSWTVGAHSLKFGTYVYRLRFNPLSSPNARGTFNFTPRFTSSAAGTADGNAFADFLLGFPSSAQIGIGRGETDGRALWTHFYAQDDWRPSTRLSLNLGVRYEINGQMIESGNRFSNPELGRFVVASDNNGRIHPDANSLLPLLPVPYVTSKEAGYHRSLQRPNYSRIAPRIGLAWSPAGASDRYVVRAGFGLFFNQAGYSINESLALNLPFYFNKSITIAADQRVPSFTTTNILLAPNTGSLGGSGLMYNYRSEYAESWTLSMQRSFRNDWAVMATYLGSRVIGADNSTYLNIPQPGPGPIDARRPNPALSAIRAIRWDGWSEYHSMTLKLEKRFSSRFAFDANYTWSKAMDDASDVGATFHEFNIPQDVRNIRAETALSSFHHAHRFVFTGTYEFLNGWTVNTIGTFQTGAPITINLPNDNANVGPGPAQRPNLMRNPNLKTGRTPERWFDTDAFAMPAPFTFGNAGRNIVYEDGETNVDLSITKQFQLRDKAQLEFRTEIFNVFNFLNFVGAPGRIAFTPNFGRVFNAGPSRQMQLGLKMMF
jgi:hypothetical protein